jgi:hypothetical protein
LHDNPRREEAGQLDGHFCHEGPVPVESFDAVGGDAVDLWGPEVSGELVSGDSGD